MTEYLAWLNLLLIPVTWYVIRNEHRLTKLEALPPRVTALESALFHRRRDDLAGEFSASEM